MNKKKLTICMEVEDAIYPEERQQHVPNNPEDAIKVKDDTKAERGIDPAKHCISGQNAPA